MQKEYCTGTGTVWHEAGYKALGIIGRGRMTPLPLFDALVEAFIEKMAAAYSKNAACWAIIKSSRFCISFWEVDAGAIMFTHDRFGRVCMGGTVAGNCCGEGLDLVSLWMMLSMLKDLGAVVVGVMGGMGNGRPVLTGHTIGGTLGRQLGGFGLTV
jgi:hypothetical protein